MTKKGGTQNAAVARRRIGILIAAKSMSAARPGVSTLNEPEAMPTIGARIATRRGPAHQG
jgi:hypothetical protein